jgi:DNA-binding MarR family transcriptional regulator
MSIGKRKISGVGSLVNLLKVATRIGRPMRDGVGDPEQLSVTELRIVLALGGEGALAGHELAELMAMQPMNVSRALATLASVGLVKPADNEGNRRRKPYALTESGLEKYENMLVRMGGVAQFVFDGLNKGERDILDTLLEKLDQKLVEWESPPDQSHVNRA